MVIRTRVKIGFIVGMAISALIIARETLLRITQVPFDSIEWRSDSESEPTKRQRMIKDVINNVLPGKDARMIEELLGPALTPAGVSWSEAEDGPQRKHSGYLYQEYDWDMMYLIGRERIFLLDKNGTFMSPDEEYLMIRMDTTGVFCSWYIHGSSRWPGVVGNPGRQSFSQGRSIRCAVD